MKVKSQSEVAQSCPTLSDPIDCSPPGSSVHGIFQARVLEWGAIAFSEDLVAPISSVTVRSACRNTCPVPLSVVLFPVVESITALSLLAAVSYLFPPALRQRWCPPKICLLNSRWTVLEISSCYSIVLALKTKYNHPNRLFFFFYKHPSFGISISTATLSLLQLWTQ